MLGTPLSQLCLFSLLATLTQGLLVIPHHAQDRSLQRLAPGPLGPAAPCGIRPGAGTQTQPHVELAGGPRAWAQNGDLTCTGDYALERGTLGHRGWQGLNLCMGCPKEGNSPSFFWVSV